MPNCLKWCAATYCLMMLMVYLISKFLSTDCEQLATAKVWGCLNHLLIASLLSRPRISSLPRCDASGPWEHMGADPTHDPLLFSRTRPEKLWLLRTWRLRPSAEAAAWQTYFSFWLVDPFLDWYRCALTLIACFGQILAPEWYWRLRETQSGTVIAV